MEDKKGKKIIPKKYVVPLDEVEEARVDEIPDITDILGEQIVVLAQQTKKFLKKSQSGTTLSSEEIDDFKALTMIALNFQAEERKTLEAYSKLPEDELRAKLESDKKTKKPSKKEKVNE